MSDHSPSTLRLSDILHRTKLEAIEQVMESLEAVNQAGSGFAAIKARNS